MLSEDSLYTSKYKVTWVSEDIAEDIKKKRGGFLRGKCINTSMHPTPQSRSHCFTDFARVRVNTNHLLTTLLLAKIVTANTFRLYCTSLRVKHCWQYHTLTVMWSMRAWYFSSTFSCPARPLWMCSSPTFEFHITATQKP